MVTCMDGGVPRAVAHEERAAPLNTDPCLPPHTAVASPSWSPSTLGEATTQRTTPSSPRGKHHTSIATAITAKKEDGSEEEEEKGLEEGTT
jgi:hypothetical protein